MPFHCLPAALAAALIAESAGPAPAARPASALDWPALADRIARQMALQPGERVLLLAHPAEFQPLLPPLRSAVERAGGVAVIRPVTTSGPAAPLPEFDVVVALPGVSPEHPDYGAAHAALGEARRAVHFHWRGAGPAPSAWPVAGHPLPADSTIDATYERAVLGTDCAELGVAMRRFESALRRGEVRVTTPLGTDLRFRVGSRPVNVQDGDASAARARRARIRVDRDVELPCGVLRVAPLEETVTGVVAFPPSRWAGQAVEGLRLRFERGRVVETTAVSGREAVETEMKSGGEAAGAFREFALGFNPLLAVPAREPWIPYYGYGAGVVRLALGDNSELGGAVGGGRYVRWNFFIDATVRVGGRVWVKDGELASRRRIGKPGPLDSITRLPLEFRPGSSPP